MFYENEFDFLQTALKKCGLGVTFVSPGDTILDIVEEEALPVFEKLFSPEITLEGLFGKVEPNVLYKFKDSFSLLYNAFLLPKSIGKAVVVLGPFLQERLSESVLLELCEQNGFEPKHQKMINEFFATLPIIPEFSPIYVFLDSFFERVWEGGYKTIDVSSDLFPQDSSLVPKISGRELDDTFLDIKNVERRYAFENEILDAVTLGCESKLNRIFSAFNEAFFEKRVSDQLRNAKNYSIIMNTLLRKAAERGGVHPIYLDRISSRFAAEIEQFSSIKQGNELMIKMFKEYCRLVRKHSSASYSPIVKLAVTAIDSDLSAELSLNALANQLNVSKIYLSTIFKKETGKTITEYVNNKRVSYAKHLLCTTSLQVQTISLHCGIMDVHYFSKLFKQITGKTPSRFRAEAKSGK